MSSNCIPPQNKRLNMVIPILMHICLEFECCKLLLNACHPMKYDVINNVKLFPKAYHRT